MSWVTLSLCLLLGWPQPDGSRICWCSPRKPASWDTEGHEGQRADRRGSQECSPHIFSFLQRKCSALCQYHRWKVELQWRFSVHCSVHDNVVFSYHCAISALSHLLAVSCFTAFPLLWCLCVCFATWVWKTTCFLLVLSVLSLKGSNFKTVVPLFKFKIHFYWLFENFLHVFTHSSPLLSLLRSPS